MGTRTDDDLDVTAGSSIGPLPHGSAGRLRIHGKRFAHGEERTRLRGLTYGPFAPMRKVNRSRLGAASAMIWRRCKRLGQTRFGPTMCPRRGCSIWSMKAA